MVDDDLQNVASLSQHVAGMGHSVLSARDGQEALELATIEQPNVIFLAVNLSRMDSVAVCRCLKLDEKLAEIPVVLLGEADMSEEIEDCLDAGADDYIVKPLTGEALAMRIRLVIRAAGNHDELIRIGQQFQQEAGGRKRAEKEAASLRKRMEFILSATKAGFVVVDTHLRLSYVDPRWRAAHGDPGLKKCCRYFGCGRGGCSECAIRKAMATGEAAMSEHNLSGEDHRLVRIVSIPFRNGHDCWSYATVIVDISERKVLEEDLAQARKLEAFGQLAAGIAHEINTPIQYIGDNTRFLQDAFGDITRLLSTIDKLVHEAKKEVVGPAVNTDMENAVFDADIEYLTEEIPVAIRQSLEGVDRVSGTVRAMKELSHPGGEEMVPTDINHVIENTLTISRNEWKYVADLITDFDPDLPLIPCFVGDISQVVLNLVVNAAQAISEAAANDFRGKGTITLRTRREADYVVIRVEDTGTGIAENVRDKVFEPFFTTKPMGKGTGQGLAIVRAIVNERLDGTIGMETEFGSGTTFVIRMPITSENEAKSDLDTSGKLEYSST